MRKEAHAPCKPEAGKDGVSDSNATPIPWERKGGRVTDRLASVFSVPQS